MALFGSRVHKKRGSQQFRGAPRARSPVVRVTVVVEVVRAQATIIIDVQGARARRTSYLPKPLRTHHRLSAYAVLTVEFDSEWLWCR
jgi:hypothetical protein